MASPCGLFFSHFGTLPQAPPGGCVVPLFSFGVRPPCGFLFWLRWYHFLGVAKKNFILSSSLYFVFSVMLWHVLFLLFYFLYFFVAFCFVLCYSLFIGGCRMRTRHYFLSRLLFLVSIFLSFRRRIYALRFGSSSLF